MLVVVLSICLPVVAIGSSAYSSPAPASILKFKTSWAGYVVSNINPGSSIAVQAKWNVPSFNNFCAPLRNHNYFQFDVRIAHIFSTDIGSSLLVGCLGASTVYNINFYIAGNEVILPPSDVVSAGDQMQTAATLTVATGAVQVIITDITAGWTYPVAGFEAVSTSLPGSVDWLVYGSTHALPMFTTLKTSGDIATLGNHHGTLGSFLLISSDKVLQDTMIDSSTMHVLAQPSAISKTSSSFSVTWKQAS